MMGNTLLILPFGLLPVFFVIAFLFFTKADEGVQKNIGSKIRAGITEYPTEVSLLLYGENEHKIEFTDDGKSIILTINSPKYNGISDISDAASIKKYLKLVDRGQDRFEPDLFDCLVIEAIVKNEETGIHRVTVTLPDEIVRSEKYVEHEIFNVGRVFKRNNGNSIRWLLHSNGERRISKKDGRMFVYIDRLQVVPGFLDEKAIIMSERQITRNIKNRLWNRLDVKCISIDEKTYCGEIIGITTALLDGDNRAP
jgi:hypothetical protein